MTQITAISSIPGTRCAHLAEGALAEATPEVQRAAARCLSHEVLYL
jgi:hypothetical protein